MINGGCKCKGGNVTTIIYDDAFTTIKNTQQGLETHIRA